jgi:uncharacterized membrane protein
MLLTFLNLGSVEIGILLFLLLVIIAIGNYGKNTALGYWGSVLLALVSTPVVAFIVILVLRSRNPQPQGNIKYK